MGLGGRLPGADNNGKERPPMSQSNSSVSPLRGLLEVTRLVRAANDVPELLGAIARTIAESLGYRCVAVNVYRDEWDDFECTTVYGPDEARSFLLGRVRRIEEWEPLLAEPFERRGAYVIRAGEFDWAST